MLSLSKVACRRDGRLLFDDASLVVQAGQKVGLTGANGTGKSSLFALLQGELEPDAGELQLQAHVGITHIAQETRSSPRPAIDFVIDGDKTLRRIESAIAALGPEEGVRHASLLGELEQAGGWTVRARAGALLIGLGFPTAQHAWPVARFSGGWRMRLNLAQALISPNELLLLDEPTNHLDLDAVIWLETWLRDRQGSLILISHDREFLDATTTHTLNIDQGKLTLVRGNYSAFERWREARDSTQQAQHEKQMARRKELQAFVDRFRAKATKARQAQSRLKMLERMQETEAPRSRSPFRFQFLEPKAAPSPLVKLDEARFGYGDTVVLDAIKLTLQSGDRIGLLGVNGAGKSTLVKGIVGELPLQGGHRTTAQRLGIGYFAQHQVDQLDGAASPLSAFQSVFPEVRDSDARNFLGSYGFVGDLAMQRVHTLSGGERARLALALIVRQRPNLLLLDEPTNHLDIDMRQALAEALVEYSGALLVISHDRTLLRSVVDDLWLVSQGRVARFDDDLDGYARWLVKARANEIDRLDDSSDGANSPGAQSPDAELSAEQSSSAKSPGVKSSGAKSSGAKSSGVKSSGVKSSGAKSPGAEIIDASERKRQKRHEAEQRNALRPLRRAVEQSERQLESAMAALSRVREQLAGSELYLEENRDRLAGLLRDEGEAKQQLDRCEESLLDQMAALEAAETRQQETGA